MLRTAPPKLARIQAPVREELEAVLRELERVVASDYAPLADVSGHVLLRRGKLFRPTLLLLSNRVGDRRDDRAVTLAALVELVHLATLVHDDAVDHSVLRRGMPTVNALWNHRTAIIMGDFLYSRSMTELARFGRVDLFEVLARAANEMSVGELRALESADALELTEEEYDRLIAAKTASLMSAACELGALLGDETYREPLARFGRELGMAFQIADDLLDITETEAITGKPAGQDLREHKVTLPLIAALKQMDSKSRKEVEAFYADPEPSDEGIARVVHLVREFGGLDYARERAEEYGERAHAALREIPDSGSVESLRDAVSHAIGRRR